MSSRVVQYRFSLLIAVLVIDVAFGAFCESPVQWYSGYDGNDPNTVGLWHLDGDATNAVDADGDGVATGTLSYAQGTFNQGAVFDGNGSGDGIVVDTDPDYPEVEFTSQSFTAECWIKPTRSTTDGWQTLMGVMYGWEVERYNNTGTIRFTVFQGGSAADERVVWGATDIPNDVWSHIACTFDYDFAAGSTLSIYVNGQLDGSFTTEAGWFPWDGYDHDLGIGCNPSWVGREFTGMIDEVRISNTVRTFESANPWVTESPDDELRLVQDMVNLDVIDSGIDISWNSVEGAFYDIEWKDSITTPWRSMGLNIQGDGDSLHYYDQGDPLNNRMSPVDVGQRFYKVTANAYVPIPFEPISYSNSSDSITVSIWGRDYTFEDGPFPTSIISLAEEILYAPIKIYCRVDGQYMAFDGDQLQVLSSSPEKVVFSSIATSALVDIEAQITVEYDGFMVLDWQVIPNQTQSVEVQQLIFDIELNAENAIYYAKYHDRNARGWSEPGYLPAGGYSSGFNPVVWMGDDERGLQWVAETNRNWFNADPEHVLNFISDGNKTIFRLNLVTKPVSVGPATSLNSLDYTFGLAATPYRLMDKSLWDYRRFINYIDHTFTYGGETESGNATAQLSYAAENNIDLDEGTFEIWVKPQFDPSDQTGSDQMIFEIVLSDAKKITFKWSAATGSLDFICSQLGIDLINVSGNVSWTEDQWYHVAVTWGDAICLYNNGTLIAQETWNGTVSASVSTSIIVFDNDTEGNALFTFDDLRISNTARSSAEIAATASSSIEISSDAYTLLLDHMEKMANPGLIVFNYASSLNSAPEVGNGYGTIRGQTHTVDGRYGRGYRLGFSDSKMEYLADLGFRTLNYFFWFWDWGAVTVHDPVAFQSFSDGCHNAGMSFMPYYIGAISDIAPIYDTYGSDWRMLLGEYKITNGWPYPKPYLPDQTLYFTCFGSDWQDYFVEGIRKMMDTYGVDDVYYDGGGQFGAGCYNNSHECDQVVLATNDPATSWFVPADRVGGWPDGYINPVTSKPARFNIFEQRRLFKRLYTAAKSRNPNGQVELHHQGYFGPALAFTTSYVALEWVPTAGSNLLDTVPLDMFRVALGKQWGSAPSLIYYILFYDSRYTETQRLVRALSVALLHDVPVQCLFTEQAEMISNIWRVRDTFGCDDSEWYPYYDNSQYVSVSEANAFCSFYEHPVNGHLLVVSNLEDVNRQVTVELNAANLVLTGNVTVTLAMTEDPISIVNDEISIYLPAYGWQLIWIKP